jgi:lipoyl(octanoyl) transferase
MNKIEWKISTELVPYEEALQAMEARVADIIAGTKPQLIWLLEHPPIYTAGISAKEDDFLGNTSAPVFKINRGGKYTHHAPGMKIIYVMLDLKKFFAPEKPDVARFVEFLENWVIEVLAQFNIKGEIKKGRVGIWVETAEGEKKIAALGIKLKKWVSYHGIAINVDCNLSGFNNIVPCGIREFGVTSMKELGVKTENFDEVIKKTYEEMCQK